MKIFKLFIGLGIFFLTVLAGYAQNTPGLVWAKYAGGTDFQSVATSKSVALDRDSNVFVAGTFTGTIDLDPSESGITSLVSAGFKDMFIAKYNKSGDFVWGKRIGAGRRDEAYDVHVDASGNVYATGIFEDTVDFDPGTRVANLYSEYNQIYTFQSAFVLKLDAKGNYLWAGKIGHERTANSGATTTVYGNSISTDSHKNVVIAGNFNGDVDFDPSEETKRIISNTSSSAILNGFVAKYDSTGAFVWVRSVGSMNGATATDLAVNDSDEIFVTGNFRDSTDFNPDSNATLKLTSTSQFNYDVYIWSLSANGIYRWAKGFGGADNDFSNAIALDNQGNIYTTGSFRGEANFYPNPNSNRISSVQNSEDVFVLKLGAEGDYSWVKSLGGSNTDIAYDIAINSKQQVYTMGYFNDSVDFDPGPNKALLGGYKAVFVSQLDENGNYLNAYQIDNNGSNVSNAGGIAVDNAGNVVVSQDLIDNTDMDPTVCVFNQAPIIGTGGFFLQKVNPSVKPSCLVDTLITIIKQPTNIKPCLNDTASYTIIVSGSNNLKYQWQFQTSATSTFTDVTNTLGYSGATSAFLRISSITNAMVGNYRCKLSADNATDVFSSIVSLNISKPSTPTILTKNSEACTSTFMLQVQGLDKYKWTLANSILPDTLKIENQVSTQQGQFIQVNTLVSNFKEGTSKLYLISKNSAGCTRLDSTTLSYFTNEKATLSNEAIVGDSILLKSVPIKRGTVSFSGSWFVAKGEANIRNVNANSTYAKLYALGEYKFVYTSSNFCKTNDTISILHSNTPAIPIVFSGKDSTSCDSSITLKATPATQAGYRTYWRIAGKKANGIIIADTTRAVTLAKLSFGANAFIWTVTNGQISSSDTVIYMRSGLPNRPTIASASLEACSTSQVLQITISANDVSNKYKWTRIGAQGTDTLRIASTQLQQGTQGSSIISTIVSNYKTGTNALLLTTTNATKCFRTDQATLAYYPNEIPVLSSNTIVGDSIRLTAQSVMRGTVTYQGTWSTKGTSSIKNPSSASTVANKLSIGTNKFIYILNNFCKTRDSLSVTYLPSGSVSAGKDTATCSDTATLAATAVPQGYTGVWRSSNPKVKFSDSTKVNAKVSGLELRQNKLYWLAKLDNTVQGRDSVIITRDTIPSAIIPTYYNVCLTDTILPAQLNQGESIVWKVIAGGATIDFPTQPKSRIRGLKKFSPKTKQYFNEIEWTVTKGTCTIKDTLPIYFADSITVDELSKEGLAGDTIKVLASQNSIFSKGDRFDSVFVVPISSSNTKLILNRYSKNDTIFFVTNRKLKGDATYTYSLRNTCGATSNIATLSVNAINVQPNTKTIPLLSQTENKFVYTMKVKDIDPNNYIIKAEPKLPLPNGVVATANINSDTTEVTFTIDFTNAKENTATTYTVSFRLFDGEKEGEISFIVPSNNNLGLTIYNAVSPNGDGKHDIFEIEGIEQEIYKNNKVEIFNRWGDRVYKQSGYNNKDVAFDGGTLPDGTYYYVLDLGNDRKLLSGFLLLSR